MLVYNLLIDQLYDNKIRHIFNSCRLGYVWVGATDSKTESAWVWPNGKRLTYDRWKNEQPNEAQQQQCLAIDDDLQYQDKECDRKYYYLCSDNAGH